MRIIYPVVIFFSLCLFSYSQEKINHLDSINKYKHRKPGLALEFGLEYNNLNQNRNPDTQTQEVFSAIGEILFKMGLHANALDYLKRSIKIYQSLPESQRKFPEVDQPPGVLLNIGNIYYAYGEYEKADELFKQTISIYEKISDQQAKFFGINTAMSNRGLILQVNEQYDKAENIYRDVYQRRKKYGKTEDILYSMNDILRVLLLKNEIQKAQNILTSAKNLYKKEIESGNDNPVLKRNMGYGYFVFGAHYQSKKELEKAIFYLEKSKIQLDGFPINLSAIESRIAECFLGLEEFDKAEDLANTNLKYYNLNEREKRYNYRVLENIYKQKGLNSKLLQVKDSLISISSRLSAFSAMKSLSNLETEIQLANSARKLNESKIRYNTYIYLLIILCLILTFVMIIVGMNFKSQRVKLSLENKLINQELEKKNREILSKTSFIIQRNEYLENFLTKLSKIKSSSSKSIIPSIEVEIQKLINSDKSYKEFDKMFVSVYPNFYDKLNQLGKLSQTDLRLASLIKMNQNNYQIAQISGLSKRTIESQRYRLKKSLNLDKNDDLDLFIKSI